MYNKTLSSIGTLPEIQGYSIVNPSTCLLWYVCMYVCMHRFLFRVQWPWTDVTPHFSRPVYRSQR